MQKDGVMALLWQDNRVVTVLSSSAWCGLFLFVMVEQMMLSKYLDTK